MIIRKNIIIFILLALFLSLPHLSNNDIIIDVPETKLETSFKDALGSNFVIGFLGTELNKEVIETIKYVKPAGVILYSRNCDNREQLQKLISDLQLIAEEIGTYKFFVMIDEEPGGATRIQAFKDVIDSSGPNWVLINSRLEAIKGLGINVILAPIADFPFDKDSYINDRIIAKDKETLIGFNKEFISAARKNGVLTTLKHFPGAGVFLQDPHEAVSTSITDENTFKESLSIFKSGMVDGANFVMINHGIYENVDKRMATFSSKIIKDILIGELGFSGLVITDDMADMPLVVDGKRKQEEFILEAMKAGNNLILLSHKTEITKDVFDRFLNKYSSNEEIEEIVKDNYAKVNEFKKVNGLIFSPSK